MFHDTVIQPIKRASGREMSDHINVNSFVLV